MTGRLLPRFAGVLAVDPAQDRPVPYSHPSRSRFGRLETVSFSNATIYVTLVSTRDYVSWPGRTRVRGVDGVTRVVATHQYDVFGVTLRSEFPLPELASSDAESATPDVEIVRGEVEPVEPAGDDSDTGRRIDVEPDSCRLTFETIGSFRAEGGERVVVDLEEPADLGEEADLDGESIGSTKTFRRLVLGQIVSVVLHQRGHLVLHASAVERDGRAAVFLGPTGAGKTTTAAACYSEGFSLVDDDVVAIEFDDGDPLVRPGVSELKLFEEPASALGIDVSPPDGCDHTEKRYHWPEPDEDRSSVPLGACYRLAEGDELEIEPIPPQDRLMTLISNTYTVGLLDTTETTPEHFRQCSQVVETTPIRDLTRPEALDQLPELAELVAADLERA